MRLVNWCFVFYGHVSVAIFLQKYGLAGDFANGFFNRREAGAGQLLRDGKGFNYRYPACWLQEV